MGAAIAVGFGHTLLSPDHYLPFIMLARADRWSWRKAVWITALCGLARVVGTVLLGLLGVALGHAIEHTSWGGLLEGHWAALVLIIFGLIYAWYGLRDLVHDKPHTHLPKAVADAIEHEAHECDDDCPAPETVRSKLPARAAPWLLFAVFLLGPCKVLAIGLIVPAMEHGTVGIVTVSLAFGVSTLLAMTGAVMLGAWGVGFIKLGRWERYGHLLTGLVIILSGIALYFLGQDHSHHQH